MTFLFVLFCGSGLTFGAESPGVTTSVPEITYLEEMKPFPAEFKGYPGEASGPLRVGGSDAFQKEWQQIATSVSVQVESKSIRDISRWARAEMASFTFPEHWLEGLPMEPIAQTSDHRRVLFSQKVSQGFPLPSHSPLVFRRVLVAAEFDTWERQITKVFITIRGWREE